jgi:hypothetical protein
MSIVVSATWASCVRAIGVASASSCRLAPAASRLTPGVRAVAAGGARE